jgi:hypothetical protein
MPGAGKTACALELAYTHEHAFERLVWFKAKLTGAAVAQPGGLSRYDLTELVQPGRNPPCAVASALTADDDDPPVVVPVTMALQHAEEIQVEAGRAAGSGQPGRGSPAGRLDFAAGGDVRSDQLAAADLIPHVGRPGSQVPRLFRRVDGHGKYGRRGSRSSGRQQRRSAPRDMSASLTAQPHGVHSKAGGAFQAGCHATRQVRLPADD